MVFEVKHPNSSKTHYIIGTMHIGSNDAYSFVEEARFLLRKVTLYAAEMNLDEAASVDFSEHYLLPDGTNISDYMNPRLYQRCRRILLKAYQIDLDDIARYKPLILMNLLGEKIIEANNKPPLDHYLWRLAKQNGVETTGVESVSKQKDILIQIPLDYQFKALKKTARRVDKYAKYLKQLSATYASGNYKALFKMTNNSMGGVRKLMIHDRNQEMVNRCIDLFDNHDSVFVGVGCGHVGGHSGIRAALLRKGYKVKPFRL